LDHLVVLGAHSKPAVNKPYVTSRRLWPQLHVAALGAARRTMCAPIVAGLAMQAQRSARGASGHRVQQSPGRLKVRVGKEIWPFSIVSPEMLCEIALGINGSESPLTSLSRVSLNALREPRRLRQSQHMPRASCWKWMPLAEDNVDARLRGRQARP